MIWVRLRKSKLRKKSISMRTKSHIFQVYLDLIWSHENTSICVCGILALVRTPENTIRHVKRAYEPVMMTGTFMKQKEYDSLFSSFNGDRHQMVPCWQTVTLSPKFLLLAFKRMH